MFIERASYSTTVTGVDNFMVVGDKLESFLQSSIRYAAEQLRVKMSSCHLYVLSLGMAQIRDGSNVGGSA